MTLETIWLEIRTHLEQKKREINDEIINYPPPIPACDAQFNYLLEERARIGQVLNQLRRLTDTVDSNSAGSLREFIDTCTYIDAALMADWKLEMT